MPQLKMIADFLGPRVMFDDHATAVHPRFDSQLALAALKETTIRCAPPDRQLLTIYSNYLQGSGSMIKADPEQTVNAGSENH